MRGLPVASRTNPSSGFATFSPCRYRRDRGRKPETSRTVIGSQILTNDFFSGSSGCGRCGKRRRRFPRAVGRRAILSAAFHSSAPSIAGLLRRDWCAVDRPMRGGVEKADTDRPEVDRPKLLGHLQQTYLRADENFAQKDQPTLPFDLSVGVDLSHRHRRVVFDRASFGERTVRFERAGRSLLPQPLMRPDVVELLLERVEASLMTAQVFPRISDDPVLERSMHSLVNTVLVGTTRMNAHRRDSELDPPPRQLRQTAQR